MRQSQLPDTYRLRAPSLDDQASVYALINTCDIADTGAADMSEIEWRRGWQTPTFSLRDDAWVVTTGDGQIIAEAEILNTRFGPIYANLHVHPEHRGRGIGTALCARIEQRARECIATVPMGNRVTLEGGINVASAASRRFIAHTGMTQIRSFWHMAITLDPSQPVAQPVWPAGIRVRTFIPGQDDRPLFEAVNEAFEDHWGHIPEDYAEWELRLHGDDFDPNLWFLAMDGEQIAGAMQGRIRFNHGWVGRLSVRRPWRRMGLGNALLRQAFAIFQQRGFTRVALGVDSQNLAGATRLYERAGMRPYRQFDAYEKELRAGVDATVRSL